MRSLIIGAPGRTGVILCGEAAEVVTRDVTGREIGWRRCEEPDGEVVARDAIVGVDIVREVERRARGDGTAVRGGRDRARLR